MCCAASFRDPALHMMPRFFCFDSTMPPTDTAGVRHLSVKEALLQKRKHAFAEGVRSP